MKLLALLAILLIGVAAIQACDIFCTQEYAPVCGKMKLGDGSSTTRQFTNSCYMRLENRCNKGNYVPC